MYFKFYLLYISRGFHGPNKLIKILINKFYFLIINKKSNK